MTSQVVCLDRYADLAVVRAALAARSPGLDVSVRAADAVPQGRDVVALLAGPETPLRADDLGALPDLRVIAATSAGYDHVPVQAAAAHGIWVTTAAGYCTEEVAESTLALGLDLLRGVTALDGHVRAGGWDVSALRPRRVAGIRWGLVGAGRIARALARRLSALEVQVRAWDPRAEAPTGLRAAAGLDELLADSDVVSLHLPLTDATRGLIGERELRRLPPGALLINVARGELLDLGALDAALRDGHLAGAALDVLPTEPPPPDGLALALPRTVLTPHAAWYSESARILPYQWAAESVADVLSGRRPDRAVGGPLAVSR